MDAPVDWDRVSRRLKKRLPRVFETASSQGRLFLPKQRMQFASHVSGIRDPLEPIPLEEILDTFARQAQIYLKALGRRTVVIGIAKKGEGLLREIAEENPSFRDLRVLSDKTMRERDVRGRNVLLVDDSVHSGRTMKRVQKRLRRWGAGRVVGLAVLGSERGMAAVERDGVRVVSLYLAPEELFWFAFQQLLVPLLALLRNGAIPDRPHKVYEIVPPRGRDATAAAIETLSALARIDGVARLTELVALDGVAAKVFHGTLQFNARARRQIRKLLVDVSEVEQMKLRVFVGPGSPIHFHLCAIFWPVADVRSKKEAAELEAEAAEWMFTAAENYALRSLASRGYNWSNVTKGGHPRPHGRPSRRRARKRPGPSRK